MGAGMPRAHHKIEWGSGGTHHLAFVTDNHFFSPVFTQHREYTLETEN